MAKKIYLKWVNMRPLTFIFTTTFLSFISMIPIAFALISLDIEQEQIGGFKYDEYSFIGFFMIGVIIAPLIETTTSQWLPIKLTQKLLKDKYELVAILLSSSFFAFMHSGYSVFYSFLIFPLGFLLAKTYIIFQKRTESSFWMTTAVHALRNFITAVYVFGYGMGT